MMMPTLWVSVLMLVLVVVNAGAATPPAGESAPPFELRDGLVYLPEWDDPPTTTATVEILKVKADRFGDSVKIERHMAVVEDKPAISKPVVVPRNTTELYVIGRSQPESEIFPFLRITIEPDQPGAASSLTQVHEALAQSLSMSKIAIPIPAELRGKSVRIKIAMLNPSNQNDKRQYFLLNAIFRGHRTEQ